MQYSKKSLNGVSFLRIAVAHATAMIRKCDEKLTAAEIRRKAISISNESYAKKAGVTESDLFNFAFAAKNNRQHAQTEKAQMAAIIICIYCWMRRANKGEIRPFSIVRIAGDLIATIEMYAPETGTISEEEIHAYIRTLTDGVLEAAFTSREKKK